MSDPRANGIMELDYIDGRETLMAETAKSPQEGRSVQEDWIGREMAVGTTSLLAKLTLMGKQQNPDELVQKKGLAIFDTMKQDAQVKATLFIKKFTRLATDWFIKPASESSADKQIAEFYELQLRQLPGTVMNFLLAIMTMLDYGYSVVEENYYFIEEGDNRGKIGLSSLKSKKPHDIGFTLDDYNNIKAITQMQGGVEKELPEAKFIVTSWMPQWEDPYGESDLKAAYIPWWQKDVMMRFQAIWLERYPSPFLLGKYPPGTDQDTIDLLLEVLEDLQIHTEAVVPEGLDIDTVKMDRTGSDIYTKAIAQRDTMISRALLVPELLGFTDKASGSYALGKKQVALFLGVLGHLGRTIEETINEQLTNPYIAWNFPVKEYPQWQFYPLTEETTEEKAKILAVLAQAKLIDAENPEMRKAIGDYLNILPEMSTIASEEAEEAMSFEEPWKFYSPDGKDGFMVEILETAARAEMLNDALQKTGG